MFNVSKMKYHPMSEKIANHLSTVTQNQNKHLFRVMLTYYFGMITAHMRVGIHGWGESTLPVNIYAISLSESGTGKGYTMNILNNTIAHRFRDVFLEETFAAAAEQNILDLAEARAKRRGTSEEKEEEKLLKEYVGAGEVLFQFSEGTPAAVKQFRHKLCLARAGALNYIVDEIGSNLLNQKDMINLFLELYDTGRIEDKLVKNTSENQRVERIEGATPSNMLLIGAASALLDGGETESKFNALLETGYARRCFFSFNRESNKTTELSPEELVAAMFNKHQNTDMSLIAESLEKLADPTNLEKVLELDYDAAVYLMKYKVYCIQRGQKFKDHQKIMKAEMDNRFFKVLKLAAAYSFVDMLDEISIDYINYAIKVAEESGREFTQLMTPEKDYMKLAKFLVDFGEKATLSDLDLHLPCFSGPKARKDEMISNATAWGYKNNIIITKHYIDQILFLQANVLQETDLDDMILTISDHPSYNYEPAMSEDAEGNEVPVTFEELELLGLKANYQWCNHYFHNDYRHDDNVIPGFNLIVLDVDDGTPLSTAQLMFQDYYALFYETKRSTVKHNRYRVVIPTSHILELDGDTYKEFMTNVIDSLPFDIEVDEASKQASKKWLTNDSGVLFNDVRYVNGKEADPKLFDVLPYIPKTSKNEQRIRDQVDIQDLDRIQRWTIENTGEGNRNKQLYNYAMILVDMGADYATVEEGVLNVNSKLKDPIAEKEIKNTILASIHKKIK